MDFLLALAVIPGLFLVYRVYRMDKVESEPLSLLLKCLFFGVLSIIPAIVLEMIFDGILDAFIPGDTVLYYLIDCFLIIGIAEELSKYVLLKKATWKHSAFDFCFDGVVYAVSVSAGFAILENILYVDQGGLSVAIIRAITSIPGHIVFGVFMGLFYGQAKLCDRRGDDKGRKRNLRKAVLVPVLLHGLYDFLAFLGGIFSLAFLALIIVLDVVAIRKIKRAAWEDQPLEAPVYPLDFPEE